MKKTNLLLFLILFVNTGNGYSQTTHPDPETLRIGTKAPDFSLPGIDGKKYSLKNFEKSPVLVIIFSCNHCPTAQAYEDRIIAIDNDYRSKGVSVVMISPNSTEALNYSELGYTDMGDSFGEMKLRAKNRGFTFPYLYDGDTQKCALAYGPVATPQWKEYPRLSHWHDCLHNQCPSIALFSSPSLAR